MNNHNTKVISFYSNEDDLIMGDYKINVIFCKDKKNMYYIYPSSVISLLFFEKSYLIPYFVLIIITTLFIKNLSWLTNKSVPLKAFKVSSKTSLVSMSI